MELSAVERYTTAGVAAARRPCRGPARLPPRCPAARGRDLLGGGGGVRHPTTARDPGAWAHTPPLLAPGLGLHGGREGARPEAAAPRHPAPRCRDPRAGRRGLARGTWQPPHHD